MLNDPTPLTPEQQQAVDASPHREGIKACIQALCEIKDVDLVTPNVQALINAGDEVYPIAEFLQSAIIAPVSKDLLNITAELVNAKETLLNAKETLPADMGLLHELRRGHLSIARASIRFAEAVGPKPGKRELVTQENLQALFRAGDNVEGILRCIKRLTEAGKLELVTQANFQAFIQAGADAREIAGAIFWLSRVEAGGNAELLTQENLQALIRAGVKARFLARCLVRLERAQGLNLIAAPNLHRFLEGLEKWRKPSFYSSLCAFILCCAFVALWGFSIYVVLGLGLVASLVTYGFTSWAATKRFYAMLGALSRYLPEEENEPDIGPLIRLGKRSVQHWQPYFASFKKVDTYPLWWKYNSYLPELNFGSSGAQAFYSGYGSRIVELETEAFIQRQGSRVA